MQAHLVTDGPRLLNATTGARVRLRCVNWYGAHQEPLVPGGLELTTAERIAALIAQLGANCVRLPLSDYGVIRNPWVEPRFIQGIAGFKNNSTKTSYLQVLDHVIHALTSQGLMVILNSHTSVPGWVGAQEALPQGLWHGNGLSTADWANGLALLGARYQNNPLMIGIDLRNEIHDQEQQSITWGESTDPDLDWLAAATLADNAISAVNPHALIIVGGLCRAYDLRPLMEHIGPVEAYKRKKLVYTAHVYLFSWWWTWVNWTPVVFTAVAGLLLVLWAIACHAPAGSFYHSIDKPQHTHKRRTCNARAALAAFCPFAALWIAIACAKSSIALNEGCQTIANESYVWILVGILLLIASLATLFLSFCCSLCEEEGNYQPVLTSFLAWTALVAAAVLATFLATNTYWIVQDELLRWRLQSSSVPVWIGEFGTGIGDTSLQWRYLLRILRDWDLDFAYWAVNGRKWISSRPQQGWQPEPFGLLTPDYTAVADQAFADSIFI